MQKTDWFSSEVKPIRPGIYERDELLFFTQGVFRTRYLWDGQRWKNSNGDSRNVRQDLPWRGLIKE